jgi:transcriptional regulator with XRE-family HTH domain
LASKGIKASLEPIAYRLYAQGWTLTSISERFEVSVTTLSKWKKATHRPGQDLDDWDLARQAHATRGDNLRRLFEDQEEYVLSLPVSSRDAKVHDALTKASANLRHWEDHQKAAAAALLAETETAAVEIDKPAIFLETLEWIATKLRETDPEGLKVLARNFDMLVIQFKTEHAQNEQ